MVFSESLMLCVSFSNSRGHQVRSSNAMLNNAVPAIHVSIYTSKFAWQAIIRPWPFFHSQSHL